jgi:hypothetical protein
MQAKLVSLSLLLISLTTFEPSLFTQQRISFWFLLASSAVALLRLRIGCLAKISTPLIAVLCIGAIMGLSNLQYDLQLFGSPQTSLQFYLNKAFKACLYIYLVIYATHYFATTDKILYHWNQFKLSLVACEIFGLLQLICFFFIRFDLKSPIYQLPFISFLNPIGVPIIFTPTSSIPFRLTSWCHEPKGFAGILTVLLLIKFASAYEICETRNSAFGLYLKNSMPITIILLIFSQSLSGLMIPFVFIFFRLLYLNLICVSHVARFVNARLGMLKFKQLILFLTVPLVIFFVLDFISSADILSIVSRRLPIQDFSGENSLSLINSLDPEDAASLLIFQKLSFSSFFTGLGFGGFASNVFISGDVASLLDYTFNSPFVRSLSLEIFFISGVFGLLLIISLYTRVYYDFVRSSRLFPMHYDRSPSLLHLNSLGIIYAGLISLSLLPPLFLWRGDEFMICILFGFAAASSTSLLGNYYGSEVGL